MKNSVEKRVFEIISEEFKLTPEEKEALSRETPIVKRIAGTAEESSPRGPLSNGLGADSSDLVDLIMILQEEFSVEIFDEEVPKLITVGCFIDSIERVLNQITA